MMRAAGFLVRAFPMAAAGLALALLAPGGGMSAAGPRDDVAADVERCREDPRFRIGGAAIGDCLLALSEAVDREIESAVTAGKKRYCFDGDKGDFLRAHVDWQAYRTRLCALVERSPDNTPSFVNSAACRLELGRQRLAAMVYTNEYGSPRCPIVP